LNILAAIAGQRPPHGRWCKNQIPSEPSRGVHELWFLLEGTQVWFLVAVLFSRHGQYTVQLEGRHVSTELYYNITSEPLVKVWTPDIHNKNKKVMPGTT
jgi:hypothetical protein